MHAPRDIDALHERASRPPPDVVDLAAGLTGPVLVLGAGGKMGFHLARMLDRACTAAGADAGVVAVSRFGDPGARDRFLRHGIETRSADLGEADALRDLPEAEAVFYLAGVKFGTRDRPDLLRRMNIEVPRAVAARFPDRRIVALSTGCVYGFSRPETGGSVEGDPLDGPGDYAASCRGREQAFAASRACLVRLNYSVDLRYGVLVDIAQAVQAGDPVDVTTGYVNVIWQGDAVAYVIRCLDRCTSPPSVLNVTGPEILSVREIARRMGERFGRPVRLTGTEAATAWLSNAGESHDRWGPPAVDAWTLVDWAAAWVAGGGETLGKPTRFDVRDGTY